LINIKRLLKHAKRPIFAALALVSLLMMLGTFGGMDQDSISLGRGCVQSVVFLGLFAGCTYLAGGFSSAKE
jgi:hypothetical protein